MIRIIANDGIDKSAQKYLEQSGYVIDTTHYEIDELKDELKNAQVLIVRSSTKVREALIDEIADAKSLKLIIRAGVGIDNIDYQYAESKGIAVRNTPKASSASVAELTICHIIALARNLYISNYTMRGGEWNKKQYKGIEINGKTLGLVGLGRVGREVAKRAAALGMSVQYFKRSGAVEGMEQYQYVDFDTLLGTSDFISCHVPFTKGQKSIIGKEEMKKMKDGVMIVNTSRGNVVSEDDLVEMLDSGKVSAAALDVYKVEPLANEKIMKHPKISLTPHIGASTKEAQARIGNEIIAVLENFEF
jgi:D-3-phosphoglycerate dehydrogenase